MAGTVDYSQISRHLNHEKQTLLTAYQDDNRPLTSAFICCGNLKTMLLKLAR